MTNSLDALETHTFESVRLCGANVCAGALANLWSEVLKLSGRLKYEESPVVLVYACCRCVGCRDLPCDRQAWSRYIGNIGAAGVDIFFIISGFVMWPIASSRENTTKSFLWNRITRIKWQRHSV